MTRRPSPSAAIRRVQATLLCAFAFGCGESGKLGEPELLCDEAALHLAECLGTEVPVVPNCDPDEAELALEKSCEQLASGLLDQKSDFFDFDLAAIGCRLGLYHLCEVPVCEPSLDETAHELSDEVPAGASACLLEALAYEGCGACDYYLCREDTANCGESGYLLDFAYNYCNRFRLVSESEASPAGQVWFRRVRRCLITALDRAEPSDECDSIRDAGVESHNACYAEAGFCELPISDWLVILNTISPGDIPVRQVLINANGCLREWLGGAGSDD